MGFADGVYGYLQATFFMSIFGFLGGMCTRMLIDIFKLKNYSSPTWGMAIFALPVWILWLFMIFEDGSNGPEIFGGILAIIVALYSMKGP